MMNVSKDFHTMMVGSLDRLLQHMTDNEEKFSLCKENNESNEKLNPCMESFIYMICREYVETHKGE